MQIFNWDVVSSLALSVINAQLQKNAGLTDAEFDFHDTARDLHVAGHFSKWEIVGGSGNLVSVAIALKDGTLTMGTDAPVPLAGVVVTLRIALRFLHSINADSQELRFDFTTGGKVPSEGVAMLISVTLPANSDIQAVSQALIGHALAHCVDQNPAAAAHVFASLANEGTANASYAMPKPTAIAFTYTEPSGGGGGYFSIFLAVQPLRGSPELQESFKRCSELSDLKLRIRNLSFDLLMQKSLCAAAEKDIFSSNEGGRIWVDRTNKVKQRQAALDALEKQLLEFPYNDADKQYNELVQKLIALPAYPTTQVTGLFDEKSTVAVAMSCDCLLNFVLLPQLPGLYGLQPSTVDALNAYVASPDLGRFVYNNNAISLTSPLAMDVRVDGIHYYPEIDNLSISIDDNTLKTVGSGTCHISPGINMDFSYTTNNPVTASGEGITFTSDSNPTVDSNINESVGAKIGTSIGGIFSGGGTDAIFKHIADSITRGITNNIAGFGIAHLSSNFINWQGYSMKTVKSAGLEGLFFFRGD